MKFLVQRVKEASVTVDSEVIGKIGEGFLVLIGICESDTIEIADKMIKKLLGLRIFQDENGKTNLDIKSVDGQLLLISQFTLYADCKKGNRPSFINAGHPDMANDLYEYINVFGYNPKYRSSMPDAFLILRSVPPPLTLVQSHE